MSITPPLPKSEGSGAGGPPQGPASARGGPKMSEGDWLCSDAECANWNFAWRTSCNRCGVEKSGESEDSGGGSSYSKKKKLGQEIGKAMAEKSRGLFSADDWQCNKCGNVNWARRHQCNVCNAPRYGEVEERTGYGGGYNDRGVVEYIERSESDDEWDEFGRRKKKFRKVKTARDTDSDDSGPSRSKRRKEREDRKASASERKEKEGERKAEASRREAESGRKEPEPSKPEPSRRPPEREDSDEDDEDDDDDDDEDGDLSKYDLSGWGDEEDNATTK